MEGFKADHHVLCNTECVGLHNPKTIRTFLLFPLPLALGTQVLLTFPPGDVEFCMTRSLLGCLLKPRRCWLCDEIIGLCPGRF